MLGFNVYDLFENIYNKSVYQSTGETVAKYIKNTDSVLECACGTGAISIYIAPKCNKLFASDYSVGMLKQAKKKLKSFDNVEFKKVDITNIKSKDVPDKRYRRNILYSDHVFHCKNQSE